MRAVLRNLHTTKRACKQPSMQVCMYVCMKRLMYACSVAKLAYNKESVQYAYTYTDIQCSNDAAHRRTSSIDKHYHDIYTYTYIIQACIYNNDAAHRLTIIHTLIKISMTHTRILIYLDIFIYIYIHVCRHTA
jgi:hypothetical protein